MILGYNEKYKQYNDRTTQPKVIIRQDYLEMLESKAQAFDILKRNIPINLIRQNMFVFECREYLTAEEIEILQKAGLE